jgi:DNA-binding transcriptional regulator YdaS (Cro superfamily)
MRSKALDLAIRALNDDDGKGGVSRLARALNVTTQAVSQWDDVPPIHVLEVERISGVSKHQLRPDIFGVEPEKARA